MMAPDEYRRHTAGMSLEAFSRFATEYADANRKLWPTANDPIPRVEPSEVQSFVTEVDRVFVFAMTYGAKVLPWRRVDGRPVPYCRSYDDVSADAEQIAAWRRLYPKCGWAAVSKHSRGRPVVVDVEHVRKGRGDGFVTLANLERVLGALPSTLTVETKNGGRHHWFTLPEGVTLRPTSTGGVPGRPELSGTAVDLVTGLLTLPDVSEGYTTIVDGPMGELPRAWIDAYTAPPEEARERAALDDAGRKYAVRALRSEAEQIATLATGRGIALHNGALKLSRFGELDDAEIEHALLVAAELCGKLKKDGERAVTRTIRRGLRVGGRS